MCGNQKGMSLVELLVALVLLSFVALAAAPLFMHATKSSAVGADLGSVGSLAVDRMEVLRSSSFSSLADGGSLTTNETGFFDDANTDATVRWRISTNGAGTLKTITVRAVAKREVVGEAKQVVLTSLRAM